MTASDGQPAKNAKGGTARPGRAPAITLARARREGETTGAASEMPDDRMGSGPWPRDFM
jgi:hypothetical protein